MHLISLTLTPSRPKSRPKNDSNTPCEGDEQRRRPLLLRGRAAEGALQAGRGGAREVAGQREAGKGWKSWTG